MIACPKCKEPFVANKQSSVHLTGPIVVGLDGDNKPIIDVTEATSVKPDWLQCAHCNAIIMCGTGDDWYSYQKRLSEWKPAPGYTKHEPTEQQLTNVLHSLSKEQLSILLDNLKQGGE